MVQQVSAHLHMPMQIPDPEQLRRLKETDRRAYDVWLRLVAKRARHDMWMERAPIAVPARIARFGQILGLIAVLAVLALAGYALHLNEPWVAGFLAAIDVVALAAVFASARDKQ